MTKEENLQQEGETVSSSDVSVEKPSVSKSSGRLVRFGLTTLSLVISVSAISLAGYVLMNSQKESKSIDSNSQAYGVLEKQFEKLSSEQSEQKSILNNINSQNNYQNGSIKAMQSQVTSINSQIATPTKDLYMQVSVANIQSAIDYLIMTKDVLMFSGDVQKANGLLNMAFNKIEASSVATISVSDRQSLEKSLKEYLPKDEVLKKFISIHQQLDNLKYKTIQDVTDNDISKSNSKYMKFLSSIVEVQDLSEDRNFVSTQESKKLVSENLYESLISLQNAMYINNENAINIAKNNILEILKQYFIQNDDAKALEENIAGIKAYANSDFNSKLDKLINKLSRQQDQLLTRASGTNQTNISKEVGEK